MAGGLTLSDPKSSIAEDRVSSVNRARASMGLTRLAGPTVRVISLSERTIGCGDDNRFSVWQNAEDGVVVSCLLGRSFGLSRQLGTPRTLDP